MTKLDDAYALLPGGGPKIKDYPGEGWGDLVYEMCKKLAALPGGVPEIAQIKSKFGELRVYPCAAPTAEQGEIIAEAVEKSKVTCEVCGAPGTLKKDGWIAVYCEFHMDPKNR